MTNQHLRLAPKSDLRAQLAGEILAARRSIAAEMKEARRLEPCLRRINMRVIAAYERGLMAHYAALWAFTETQERQRAA